jgi:hypothetical protein
MCFTSIASAETTEPAKTFISSNQFDIQKVTWSKLHYAASKFFISLDTEVESHILNKEQAQKELKETDSASDILAEPTSKVFKLDLHSSYLGQDSTIVFWMNSDGSALQRVSIDSGKRYRYRRFRYFPYGAWSEKRYPKDNEVKNNWHDWSDQHIDRYQIAIAKKEHLHLTEPVALFYLASVIPFDKIGQQYSTYLFHDNQAIKLNLTVQKIGPRTVYFKQHLGHKTDNIYRDINVVKVRVSAFPYPNSGGKADFSFLGYKGDIDMYIDPIRRIIVELAGDVDYLGKVHIHLKNVTLRSEQPD